MTAGVVLVLLTLTTSGVAVGGVSPGEADKLGTTLTGVGAEMAGSRDGAIPAYIGAVVPHPAGFKPGSGVYVNPYGSEKPLFSIDANSMSKYADKLADGTKDLLKKYPTFRVDVYPTHRSVVFPDWLIKNTKKNAVSARSGDGGLSLENAKAGFPFPIPQSGYQAMFNHMCGYQGVAYVNKNSAYMMFPDGKLIGGASGVYYLDVPYYDPNAADSKWLGRMHFEYDGPANKVGEKIRQLSALNPIKNHDQVWSYMPGQRRVRLAPELLFDAPNTAAAGFANIDDGLMFCGSMERYDMKLLGKREMYIPYNNYRLACESKARDVLKPYHPNPDITRWELHRVWVVEATLKPGKRHQFPKRRFYLDEDSWSIMISESYDARNVLSRVNWNFGIYLYDEKRLHGMTYMMMDILNRGYNINCLMGEGGWNRTAKVRPERFWAPATLAGEGSR
jgi:hypothetical protein